MGRYGGRINAANGSDGTGAGFTIWLPTEPLVPAAARAGTNNGLVQITKDAAQT